MTKGSAWIFFYEEAPLENFVFFRGLSTKLSIVRRPGKAGVQPADFNYGINLSLNRLAIYLDNPTVQSKYILFIKLCGVFVFSNDISTWFISISLIISYSAK